MSKMGGRNLTDYEEEQFSSIVAWKNEEPGVVSNAFHTVLAPVEWLVSKVIPEKAVEGLLNAANSVAEWLADTNDIKRDGKVECIADLKSTDLETCDNLANSVHNWAITFATSEGGATGSAGIFGLAADIPMILTIALRTIHKIGLCYGYELTDEVGKQTLFGILSASGANTMKEKTAALVILQQLKVIIAKNSWKAIEKGAENLLVKEGVIIAVRALAKQLGVNLTKRKALQAIPVVGAAVGASVNGWYIKEVGWAARREFQERWLQENKKIVFE